MAKFYFTFGSWEKFPHQNGYMVVEAEDIKDAIKTFRAKYPDINKDTVNCSDIYDEKCWTGVLYYKEGPKEVLISEKVKKQKRMIELLEKALQIAMFDLRGTTEKFKVEWLKTEIGTTKEELQEMGVDTDEVFPW